MDFKKHKERYVMRKYITAIEKNLTEDQRDMLSHIYEPTIVATPLKDTRRDVCVLPNGEIRAYGKWFGDVNDKQGKKAYLSSKDCGISWNLNYAHGKMNSCVYIDDADLYITVVDSMALETNEPGLWVFRSKKGPDDTDPEVIKISDRRFGDTFLPVKSDFSNRIWFTTMEIETEAHSAYFFYSDDFGLTWNSRVISDPAQQELVYPHKGLRWCKGNGTEPYAVELAENKFMMLLRNSTDSFYQSFSYDGGDTWTKSEPSIFYGTNTTPFFLRLSDGRILAFWNNTKPLPQPDYYSLKPFPGDYVVNGYAENSFTNRDAAHVAISDDGGETWKGFRETILNPARNNSDFRYVCGAKYAADKSVHQFQAYELPFGKILLSAGQNHASRRLLIFDVNWLYETSRSEDFMLGVTNITTHTYTKSVSGCQIRALGNGHSAWNRTYSAYPMPDPEGSDREVLNIRKQKDERLLYNIGGACWNFPSAKRGRTSATLKMAEKKITVILTDRWYNACDPYAAEFSPFSFEIDAENFPDGYVNVNINFDTVSGEAEVFFEDEFRFKVKMKNACVTGISYLILQCAEDGNSEGCYVKRLESNKL